MVEPTIKRVLDFFDIKAKVIEWEFQYYKEIPASHNGIYVIQQDQQVIYVGKGQIKTRQGKHWDKAFNNKKAKDTSGWRGCAKISTSLLLSGKSAISCCTNRQNSAL